MSNIKKNQLHKEPSMETPLYYYRLPPELRPVSRAAWYLAEHKMIELEGSEEPFPEDLSSLGEEPKVKRIHINNRRYLGNKFKLLAFISGTVERECKDINTVADIFAGTGSVASAFTHKKLITNDFLYSNYICNLAWFGAESYDEAKLENLLLYYNAVIPTEDNYMSLTFGDTFFSTEDCRKIGFVRQHIETLFGEGKLNGRERAILIASLLYAMDKIANTCGHYDAYIQNGKFEKHLELCFPQVSNKNNKNNRCYCEDSNRLAERIEADLVYIDPPYNSRQYCDAYHLPENVAKWEQPAVTGVARKMDRSHLKSDYCTVNAAKSFEDLVEKLKAKYILLSYNNMASKGNQRSNAKISDEDILRILSRKGKVTVFSESYKAFSAGKSNIEDNKERLFLCECYDHSYKEPVQSPLNYMGGKFKLLPQILPHFPTDVTLFVDLFCGGANVGINVPCNRVIFNDNNDLLRRMFTRFQALEKHTTFEMIGRIIEDYSLSDSETHGYEYYKCHSSEGLAKYNSPGYLRLRQDYNRKHFGEYDPYIMLYVLIVYAFNNQIRFNRKGEFNLPVGKRDFNKKMREKLSVFIDRLKSGDYTFESQDFRMLENHTWDEKTFVYADPPYLIACATYNEQDGWNEGLERELHAYLDDLHRRGIRFALSNVLQTKGKQNKVLLEWLNENLGKYRVIYLDHSYSNSNYQIKDRSFKTDEVLIVNY